MLSVRARCMLVPLSTCARSVLVMRAARCACALCCDENALLCALHSLTPVLKTSEVPVGGVFMGALTLWHVSEPEDGEHPSGCTYMLG